MLTLDDLAACLAPILQTERFAGQNDPHGFWQPTDRVISSVGLVLESWPGIVTWVTDERLDALIVHRPWDVPLAELAEVGVLAYHLAFDEAMTLGMNPFLAKTLGFQRTAILGWKAGRPIGMIGSVPPEPPSVVIDRVHTIFGGLELVEPGTANLVHRIAVVGAMTDALVREAAARGADLYVTGQFREPARAAVHATSIGIIAVGHQRAEEWGLATLAAVMRMRLPTLRVVVPDRPGRSVPGGNG